MSVTVPLPGGRTAQLREEHDFAFLGGIGTVFQVFDRNDSGNISFGLESPDGRRWFVKYAGARTLRFDGDPQEAVDALRTASQVYDDLRHPALVRLVRHETVGRGYLAVFEWTPGECLHAYWDFDRIPKYTHPDSPTVRFRALDPARKNAALDTVFEFHRHVAAAGYVAVDFYDGSVLYDFDTGRTTLCDIDYYRKAPAVNDRGRMPGSSRFLSPEETTLGAALDEITNVYAMGAFAFEAYGDNHDRSLETWIGPAAAYRVAARAVASRREDRYPSIGAFMRDWSAAFDV